MFLRKLGHHFRRQPARFAAEDKDVVGLKRLRVKALSTARRYGEEAPACECRLASRPVSVAKNAGKLVVVETGAFELAVVPAKSQWFDQVKLGARVGAQADAMLKLKQKY